MSVVKYVFLKTTGAQHAASLKRRSRKMVYINIFQKFPQHLLKGTLRVGVPRIVNYHLEFSGH